jgi:hypothetical protein
MIDRVIQSPSGDSWAWTPLPFPADEFSANVVRDTWQMCHPA